MVLKVLFLRQMAEALQSYFHDNLKEQPIELIFPDTEDESKLMDLVGEADVLIGWRPSYELLEQAAKAKVLINPGVGVKRHIEPFRKLNSTRSEPLMLVNGHGNAYFTAEHSVALLLSLLNKIVPYHSSMVAGKWRDNAPGSSISIRDKTIGLLGYGAINRYVHSFLKGFGPKFIALKQSWDEEDGNLELFTPDELGEFLEKSDILMVAVPHTSQTQGMIGVKELDLLGPQGFLVNVGRGVVIEEQGLYDALKEKKIAGAGIDVWYDYQPQEDETGFKFPSKNPFYELDNVVISPHRAASPFDDLKRWDEQIENLKRMAAGRTDLLNIVDLEREY